MKIGTEIFRNVPFLRYWVSGLISGLGDGIFTVALAWMCATAKSGWLYGVLLSAMSLPRIVLSPIGGVFVDRHDPRRVMNVCNMLRALLMGLLLVFSAGGLPPLWALFVMALLFGITDAFYWPAVYACRQRLVKPELYVQSNSLLMIAMKTHEIVGPVLGGVLLVAGGFRMILLLNGLTFLLALVLLYNLKLEPLEEKGQHKQNTFLEDLKVGMRFVWKSPLILASSISAFFVNAAFGAAMAGLPYLAVQRGLDEQQMGMLFSAMGAGGAAGAILFSLFVLRNPTPRMVQLSALFEGILFVLAGLCGNFWLMLLVLAGIGLMETAINIIAPSVNQAMIPRALFGRVIMSGGTPLAEAASGWLIDQTSADTVFIGFGVLEMAVAAVALFVPAIRYYKQEARQPSASVESGRM